MRILKLKFGFLCAIMGIYAKDKKPAMISIIPRIKCPKSLTFDIHESNHDIDNKILGEYSLINKGANNGRKG